MDKKERKKHTSMQTANLPSQVEGDNTKCVIQGLRGHQLAREDRKAVDGHCARALLVIDS